MHAAFRKLSFSASDDDSDKFQHDDRHHQHILWNQDQRTPLMSTSGHLDSGLQVIQSQLHLHILLVHLPLQGLPLPTHPGQNFCLLAPAEQSHIVNVSTKAPLAWSVAVISMEEIYCLYDLLHV